MSINQKLIPFAIVTVWLGSAQADAQRIRNPFDNCHTCNRPVAPIPAVSVVPPCACLETTLVPRQQVVYRDIRETRYRQETITQQVPVTQYRNVTVDEGGYQMVWVPKVVTKQIPETVYQPQTVTRMVPYQTVTRVPQVNTVYQPQTVIRPYAPYAIGTAPTPALAPQAASEPLPRTSSATPTTVTPRTTENPVQLDSNISRSSNKSYDGQISSQRAGKVSASSAAVFRRFQ